MEKNELLKYVGPYSLSGNNKLSVLYDLIIDILENDIVGDYVECGVYRGGCSMLVAQLFKDVDSDRKIWMYDTFNGMDKNDVTDYDINLVDIKAKDKFKDGEKWCYCSLDNVMKHMKIINYPHVKYIKGNVLETIPANIPEKISLLHLDTDFYISTLHELSNLYNLVEKYIIIDDYDYWLGSNTAVYEFFKDKQVEITPLEKYGLVVKKI